MECDLSSVSLTNPNNYSETPNYWTIFDPYRSRPEFAACGKAVTTMPATARNSRVDLPLECTARFCIVCAKLSVFPESRTSDMRSFLIIFALLFLAVGCQSPYRPTQIQPPGTGTVGRRDPYYQPNAAQLGSTQRRTPAYTARSNRDRRFYNSDQQKIDDRKDQEFDDTMLDDSSSSNTRTANNLVSDESWRKPELADNEFVDDPLLQASRYTPGFRR